MFTYLDNHKTYRKKITYSNCFTSMRIHKTLRKTTTGLVTSALPYVRPSVFFMQKLVIMGHISMKFYSRVIYWNLSTKFKFSQYLTNIRRFICLFILTLNLLTTTIVAPPSNASKWQTGFNSAFKGLIYFNISSVY
jgi:hypothetical protein